MGCVEIYTLVYPHIENPIYKIASLKFLYL